MDVHKPKPVRTWRELLGEIGIIVIGVLIALGAEQAIEAIHERSEAAQLRSALKAELADDHSTGIAHVREEGRASTNP